MIVTINKKIDLQKYKEDKNNVNKVAIYNIDEGMIVEEGVLNLDNYTILMHCDELKKGGNFCTVFVTDDNLNMGLL